MANAVAEAMKDLQYEERQLMDSMDSYGESSDR